eukprot:tig00000492_g1506.t1
MSDDESALIVRAGPSSADPAPAATHCGPLFPPPFPTGQLANRTNFVDVPQPVLSVAGTHTVEELSAFADFPANHAFRDALLGVAAYTRARSLPRFGTGNDTLLFATATGPCCAAEGSAGAQHTHHVVMATAHYIGHLAGKQLTCPWGCGPLFDQSKQPVIFCCCDSDKLFGVGECPPGAIQTTAATAAASAKKRSQPKEPKSPEDVRGKYNPVLEPDLLTAFQTIKTALVEHLPKTDTPYWAPILRSFYSGNTGFPSHFKKYFGGGDLAHLRAFFGDELLQLAGIGDEGLSTKKARQQIRLLLDCYLIRNSSPDHDFSAGIQECYVRMGKKSEMEEPVRRLFESIRDGPITSEVVTELHNFPLGKKGGRWGNKFSAMSAAATEALVKAGLVKAAGADRDNLSTVKQKRLEAVEKKLTQDRIGAAQRRGAQKRPRLVTKDKEVLEDRLGSAESGESDEDEDEDEDEADEEAGEGAGEEAAATTAATAARRYAPPRVAGADDDEEEEAGEEAGEGAVEEDPEAARRALALLEALWERSEPTERRSSSSSMNIDSVAPIVDIGEEEAPKKKKRRRKT